MASNLADRLHIDGLDKGTVTKRKMFFNLFGRRDERRREERFPIQEDEIVEVTVSQPGGTYEFKATLVDVSDHGLGLKMKEMTSPGGRIEVRWRKLVLFGSIRYCRETLDGPRVGVTIDYVRVPGRHGVLLDWIEYLEEPSITERIDASRTHAVLRSGRL